MTTTHTLAIQAQKGNKQAFTALFDRLYTPTYQRAYKHLQNHEDAEDATSEVFVKAWHRLGTWKPERNTFESWFFTIVRNTVIDVWRMCERHQEHLDWYSESVDDTAVGVLERIPDTRYDPLDAMVVSEGITQIETALAEIPIAQRHHRLAWILRHFEGYSQKEIARILNASLPNAKIWVHRCNEYLKQTLGT